MLPIRHIGERDSLARGNACAGYLGVCVSLNDRRLRTDGGATADFSRSSIWEAGAPPVLKRHITGI